MFGFALSSGEQRLRRHVIDIALAAIADVFSLSGLVIVAVDGEERPLLAARLPSSVGVDSVVLLEIYGRLWAQAGGAPVGKPPNNGPFSIGSDQAWFWTLPGHGDGPGPVAAALRRTALSPAEEWAMLRSLAAVASVVLSERSGSGGEAVPRVSATVSNKQPLVTAEVTVVLDEPDVSLTGTARAEDMVNAIAAAAANACRPQCRILFAGSSDVESMTVTVVAVESEGGAPVVGLAVRPRGDHVGPAVAVLSAVDAHPDGSRLDPPGLPGR